MIIIGTCNAKVQFKVISHNLSGQEDIINKVVFDVSAQCNVHGELQYYNDSESETDLRAYIDLGRELFNMVHVYIVLVILTRPILQL